MGALSESVTPSPKPGLAFAVPGRDRSLRRIPHGGCCPCPGAGSTSRRPRRCGPPGRRRPSAAVIPWCVCVRALVVCACVRACVRFFGACRAAVSVVASGETAAPGVQLLIYGLKKRLMLYGLKKRLMLYGLKKRSMLYGLKKRSMLYGLKKRSMRQRDPCPPQRVRRDGESRRFVRSRRRRRRHGPGTHAF